MSFSGNTGDDIRMAMSKYPGSALLVTSGLRVGRGCLSVFPNENLCSPSSIAPGVGAGSTLGEGVNAGESELGEGKLVDRVSVGGIAGGVGNGVVGGGLRAITGRFLDLGVFSIPSKLRSPTASRLHVLRSLIGLVDP